MTKNALLFFMLLSSLVNAQSVRSFSFQKSDLSDTIFVGKPLNSESEFRHGLSLYAGTLLIFNTVGIGYEHLLVSNGSLRLYAGAGGAFSAFGLVDLTEGLYGFLNTHLVTGSGQNHFETALGAFWYADFSYLSSSNNGTTTYRGFSSVLPLVRIGYRYQRPGASFFFRTGIGVPDMLYLSLGRSFGRINK
ncbi:MAG: hypothetical protein ACRC3B_12510 [Bacteroidia bacterium]